MKRILCCGDSNTWGNTGNGNRYDDKYQWPVLLQKKLGDNFKVVQEGLRARIAGDFETEKPYLNGRNTFEAIYRSAMPAEYIVIALGTNDLKRRYERTAEDIFNDLLWYANETERLKEENDNKTTKIIYIAPPNFKTKSDYFDANEAIRQKVSKLLGESEYSIISFDNLSMGEDGLHFDVTAHERVADAVYKAIKGLDS